MRKRARSRPSTEGAYLSLLALSAYADLSVRTLRGYLSHSTRPLPHYRVGGKILVRRSEFDTWMSRFRVDDMIQVDAIVADVLTGRHCQVEASSRF